jgi:hypothetical protein
VRSWTRARARRTSSRTASKRALLGSTGGGGHIYISTLYRLNSVPGYCVCDCVVVRPEGQRIWGTQALRICQCQCYRRIPRSVQTNRSGVKSAQGEPQVPTNIGRSEKTGRGTHALTRCSLLLSSPCATRSRAPADRPPRLQAPSPARRGRRGATTSALPVHAHKCEEGQQKKSPRAHLQHKHAREHDRADEVRIGELEYLRLERGRERLRRRGRRGREQGKVRHESYAARQRRVRTENDERCALGKTWYM